MKSNQLQSESAHVGDEHEHSTATRARYESPRLEVTRLRLITEGGTVGSGDSGDINTGFQ